MMREVLWTPIAMFVLLFAAAAGVRAQVPPGAMPSPDRVAKEITGSDAMDTAARQMGAFWQLQKIVETMAGSRLFRNQLTPEEQRLIG
jgi:hypothetical protein